MKEIVFVSVIDDGGSYQQKEREEKLTNVGHRHEKPRPLKRAEIRHIALFCFNIADVHNLTENLSLGSTEEL